MQMQLLNLIGTRKDPSLRRKSALFKKPVMLGGRRVPHSKAIKITPENYVAHQRQIDTYVRAGVMAWRAPNADVSERFWAKVTELLGDTVSVPTVSLAKPQAPKAIAEVVEAVEPKPEVPVEQAVVEPEVTTEPEIVEERVEVVPEPEAIVPGTEDKEAEEKAVIIEEPAVEAEAAPTEEVTEAPKPKARTKRTTTRRGGRKSTKKTAAGE